MLIGLLCAFAAGLVWGANVLSPMLFPDYPTVLQTMVRFVCFGVVGAWLAWRYRAQLSTLVKADWIEVFKLALIGNILYNICFLEAISRVDAVVTSMIVGTLPVVLPIVANIVYSRYDGKLSWKTLMPSLLCITVGLICVNVSELSTAELHVDAWTYISGIVLALLALASWTYYPLRNARWLRQHPEQKPMTWAIAQAVMTLPLAMIGLLLEMWYLSSSSTAWTYVGGERFLFFLLFMLFISVICSWGGTFLWGVASQRLPTVLLGPLLVFEALAGMLYTFIYRQSYPTIVTCIGMIALVLGVVFAARMRVQK